MDKKVNDMHEEQQPSKGNKWQTTNKIKQVD